MKRVLALVLAILTLAFVFTGCTKIGADGKGAVIDIYMGTKTINLDPAIAYTDENSVKIINLIFEGLFTLDQNGKLKKALAKKYEIGEDRYGNKKMTVWLNDTYWSDGSMVQANDVVYAWKRILDPDFESGAASMLYAIQGAKDAKAGNMGIDDIGLYSLATAKLEIIFEDDADIDEFLYNLASPALVPLRENKVSPYADTWSYSSRDLSTNGPFRVKKFTGVSSEGVVDTTGDMILERSSYYYLKQDVKTEDADKYVTPYRLVFHFSDPLDKSVVYSNKEKDIVDMFSDSEIFYVSNLTAETAAGYKKSQLKYDKLASTYSYIFNIESSKLFKSSAVRYAMSIALDRSEAAATVGAGTEAATGLIPSMIFNTGKGTSFRKKGGNVLSKTGDIEAAKDILAEAGINPAAYDDIYLYYRTDEANDSYSSAQMGFYSKEKALATYAKQVWEELGFYVVLRACDAKEYEDALKARNSDDENKVFGLDWQMLSPYPLYDLAPFASEYSGFATENEDGTYSPAVGITGWSSDAYNELITSAFAAAKEKDKAAILHDAEEMLLEEGAIVPVVFNCDCYVISGKLSGTTKNYFGSKIFTKTALKNYEQYLAFIPTKKKLLGL